ncbi:antimicrobial peptide Alo-3-like [Leptopilina heterotoma]|uniref:antimicrobial peptide Alo-3-like n=1 Tax=Leptopilina heterotoma TaxID=63436 RepID=UPI001CA90089|nr:antimicrobial peptide Alo-3-like [Leptopilina heterotoma]
MAGFKSFGMLLVLLATVLMMFAPIINACESVGTKCQPDGSTNCCSGFCYKQVGWAEGECRDR